MRNNKITFELLQIKEHLETVQKLYRHINDKLSDSDIDMLLDCVEALIDKEEVK
jgi:hypothetical protein